MSETAGSPRQVASPGLRFPLVARFGVFCATLLCLILPALVAGSRLAEPARADEVARLQRACGATPGTAQDSDIAQQFFRSNVSAEELPAGDLAWQAFVGRARLAQVAALLAIGLLTYLVVLLARGRGQALVASLALALLPAVLHEGHVLRPETPAVLFAMLAILLWQCFCYTPRTLRAAQSTRHGLSRPGLGLCAALASAIAVATLPAYGTALLVPGIVLTLAAVHLLLRSGRILKRRGRAALPLGSLNRRLLPWTVSSLLTPAVTLAWLQVTQNGSRSGMQPSSSAEPFLPASVLAAGPFVVLLALGTMATVLRVGARLRRPGRIGPDLVLFAACAVVLAGAIGRGDGVDHLPLAPASAILISDGVWATWMLVSWLRRSLATR